MNSLKIVTTILENIVGLFSIPNAIKVYATEPHFIKNVVLALSSSVMCT